MMEVYYKNRVTYILRACYNKMEKRDNSSAQIFVFTARAVRTCKSGQKNLPLAAGDLEKLSFAQWADSVTEKPQAELLQRERKGR